MLLRLRRKYDVKDAAAVVVVVFSALASGGGGAADDVREGENASTYDADTTMTPNMAVNNLGCCTMVL